MNSGSSKFIHYSELHTSWFHNRLRTLASFPVDAHFSPFIQLLYTILNMFQSTHFQSTASYSCVQIFSTALGALSLSLSHTHTHTLITLSLLLAFETQTFPPTIWYSPYIPIFPNPDLLKFNHMVPRFVNYLIQGWRKYGSWHLLLSQCFVPHLCPISVSTLWRTCVYIWLCTDCIRITVATK